MSDQDQIIEMLTAESPAARHQVRSRLVKVAGVGMAGLLALSACASVEGSGDADDDSQDQTEATGEETAEDEDLPDEEETAAPALEEIHEDIFASMQDAENVTMVTEGNAVDADLDDFAEEFGDDEDDVDLEHISVTVSGAVDGSATEAQFDVAGQNMTLLQNDEGFFMDGQATAFFLEQGAPEEFRDAIDMEGVYEDLADSWVDMSGGINESDWDFAIDEILSNMEEEFQDADDDSIFPWSDDEFPEGEAEERDGEDVWVYAGEEEGEMVLAADEDDPRILAVDGENEDGEPVMVTFRDWDEAEYEEGLPDGEVITEADFEEILLDNADEELFGRM